MNSAPQLPKYKSPGAPPQYLNADPWSLNTQAVTGDLLQQQASNSQFAQTYPLLQGANQQYQQNVSNATWDAGNALDREQTLANEGADTSQSRYGTVGVQQGREQGALGQLANTTTLGGLTAQRWGLNQQGRLDESTGLANANALSNQKYTADPTWGKLEAQGFGQTNDANYQSLVKKGTSEATGSQPIDPLVQQEMMRSGLTGAAGSFGAANLGKGTAGQAAAARNLGLNTEQYIQNQQQMGEGLLGAAGAYQNQGLSQLGTALQGQTAGVQNFSALQSNARANAAQQLQAGQSEQTLTSGLQQALNSQNQAAVSGNQQGQALTQAEQQQAFNQAQGFYNQGQNQVGAANTLFPHNQVGFPGMAIAQGFAQNTANQNAYNQAAYAQQVQAAAMAAGQASQQAQLNASVGNSNNQANATMGAAAAVAATCWVARSVYGWHDPKWQRFRAWLLLDAPGWFKRFYLKRGPRIAKWLDAHPAFKRPVRVWMDWILSKA